MIRTTCVCAAPATPTASLAAAPAHRRTPLQNGQIDHLDYDVPFIPVVMVDPPIRLGTLLPSGDPPTAPRP